MSLKIKILYVEDNLENRILVRRILSNEGMEVVEAENAITALNILKTSKPDLILMDINMPELDGYTLTKKIKSDHNCANIPIIAITANVIKGDREKAIDAGCDGYIEKPIDIDNFSNQIMSYLLKSS